MRGEGWGEGRFAVILVYTSNRRANAFYDGKILWIVVAKHKTSKDALRSLAHEAIGHHGIERILNEHATGGWGRLVKDIERLRADRTLGSKALRDVMDRVADLAYFIQVNGGEVAGTLTLVNAARGGKMLTPPAALTRQLERRYGDEFRSQFHFDPAALTAEAAQYLIGFRTADEPRNRAATAKRQRNERLRAKGVLEEVAAAAAPENGAVQAHTSLSGG